MKKNILQITYSTFYFPQDLLNLILNNYNDLDNLNMNKVRVTIEQIEEKGSMKQVSL
jgi:hypothetical protein